MSLEEYGHKTFDDIKHMAENGQEYWLARELQEVLEYTEWRNFSKAIDKAKIACKNSGQNVAHHFVNVNKTIDMPKGAEKHIDDYKGPPHN